MGGSKKGERRGAAGRRGGRSLKDLHPHETVGEILDEAADPRRKTRHAQLARRIEIARIIHPEGDGLAVNMTPKEIMMMGARWHAQAAQDWQRLLLHHAALPATPETTAIVERAEREIAQHLAQATDHSYKVAPYDHPRLAAIMTRNDPGANARTIVDDLLDDVDARMRENAPLMIEHDPIKKIG